ncbi:MAG: GNAT family N-acetyltransferase [Saprospiraceae bacterium]|nr:GNAT family N-acetyltransferase [Saprospiraceae bacterium]
MIDINNDIHVLEADASFSNYSQVICDEMESSAKVRGTGIAKRNPEYITQKMEEGKAVIALTKDGTWVGFCYIETWEGEYVANSGLIVSPDFRKTGVAKNIKQKIFDLSRRKYPDAKIFGLTTGLAVMKINSDLGYEPVTYSELTQDEKFWAGCKSCVNYDILTAKERKNCLCTAMLYDPKEHAPIEQIKDEFKENAHIFERFMKIKKFSFLQGLFDKGKMSDTKVRSFAKMMMSTL